jgi:hypothetical protein
MSEVRGLISAFATASLIAASVTAVGIVIQSGSRLTGAQPNGIVQRLAVFAAVVALFAGLLAGFAFGPEPGAHMMSVTVTRTWAPVLFALGNVMALLALLIAASDPPLDTAVVPASPLPRAPASPTKPSRQPDSIPLDAPSVRMPDSVPFEAPPPVRPPPSDSIPVPARRAPSEISLDDAPALRDLGVLAYATTTARLSTTGIEALLVTGEPRTVAWTAVVGVVVRRAPPDHGGAMFVDVVSTAGATLRIVPATQLTGEAIVEADRERAVVRFALAHNPDAKLDRATRAFLDREADALQLPDGATLAAHDARLA